jgi:hypothetical protein
MRRVPASLAVLMTAITGIFGAVPPATAEPTNPAEATNIQLTDEVVVKDCIPFGILLGGDSYYSGAALVKDRARMNFEGTSYRQCPWGPATAENGLISWFGASPEWLKIFPQADVTVLSGPAKGTKAKLLGVEPVNYEERGSVRQLRLWKIDKPLPARKGMSALLVESMHLGDGQFRPLDGYWTSTQNRIEVGDVPAGSFGAACLNLDGSRDKAHLRFGTSFQRYMDTNGTWHARFWAKGKSAAPRLEIACDRGYGEQKTVEVTPAWKQYHLLLKADKVPEPKSPDDNPHLLFVFQVTGGELLLDDVELWKQGDTNPTAFRDDVIATLKRYGPGGPLRHLQMGGNTVKNTLMPPLKAHSFSSEITTRLGPYATHSKMPYGLHQLYELCEYLGFEPWYSLPGTLHVEEVQQFMEYLGAPADVGFGKVRAELGHPRPWTETLKHIHVEFGNEAWNNAPPYQIGGYNGPDYWKDLIAAGKASPYYRKNVLFHTAGQAAAGEMSARIMADASNADRYSVAPYIIQSLTPEEIKVLSTDDKLFRWVFAWPLWRARNEKGAMFQNAANSRKYGIELSVYEINHHTTHGEGALAERNRIVTSLGGGINVANTMLVNLKEHGARTQCLFSLVQHSYNAKDIGAVRLWGTALNMRQGQERYRPTFLACALCNRAIRGNLVATRHTGVDPTFEATGIFSKSKGMETTRGWPTILSYGFAESQRRGLIIVNLDTTTDRPVSVTFQGNVRPGTATSYLLSAENIADNNEFETPEPKVKVTEQKMETFSSGERIIMPRHSMRALVWELQ